LILAGLTIARVDAAAKYCCGTTDATATTTAACAAASADPTAATADTTGA